MSFPKSDQGFVHDTLDHRSDEYSKTMRGTQYPLTVGPTGVAYCPLAEYSLSAKFLADPHKKIAFKAAFAAKNWSYARRLGMHIQLDQSIRKDYLKCVSKTKNTCVAGDCRTRFHTECREFLVYLGDLHVQIVRALENGAILTAAGRDLRKAKPEELAAILDDQKVPQTNEVNIYRALWDDEPYPWFVKRWVLQDDPQINRYHKLLGIV